MDTCFWIDCWITANPVSYEEVAEMIKVPSRRGSENNKTIIIMEMSVRFTFFILQA